MDYFEVIGPSLLRHTPEILAWLVGIILALRMVRLGGQEAEKLLLTGCSLMFVIQIIGPFLSGLVWWLIHEQGMSRALASGLAFSLPVGVLGVAGLLCLIYAFWLRFRVRRQGQV